MRILAIETSCDETAVAVVEKRETDPLVKVLAAQVASSEEMHVKTGGIVPEVAARAQLTSMEPVLEQTLEEAALTSRSESAQSFFKNQLDALAVTVGPGLIGSLLVGVETARTLSLAWQKPVIPVNHIAAHLYANFVDTGDNRTPEFPAIGLVISGGHTDMVLMKNHTEIEWLGGTRDDAAGECFDKTARVLDLPYPGGPSIASAASRFNSEGQKFKVELPRPMIHEESLEMSFSGLKTAVVNEVRKFEEVTDELQVALSHEIQEAITDVLVRKLQRAVEQHQPESILVAGGVSANRRLREKLEDTFDRDKLFIPPLKLCTDNAVMIGAYAAFHPEEKQPLEVTADPSLDFTML